MLSTMTYVAYSANLDSRPQLDISSLEVKIKSKCLASKNNFSSILDYVDRGPQNLETIVLLLCYKVKYPACFYLVRGNHETSPVNAIYGFKSELEQRYGQRDNIGLFWMFNDAFAQMPCSALIGGENIH